MLTLAAVHVMNDTSDPFFTSLKAGEYDKVRPEGTPCDAVFPDSCGGPQLSRGGKIAMAVSISVVGLIIVLLLAWWIWLLARSKSA